STARTALAVPSTATTAAATSPRKPTSAVCYDPRLPHASAKRNASCWVYETSQGLAWQQKTSCHTATWAESHSK
ncbi:MAG: hypothetical protein OXL96_27055, partial [Candidatus Poribacteria bacterium]|nr:hypothetical protein [Candidatus Poribacteria bacterium]